MNLLRRLLERLDSNLDGAVDRHLTLAGIPKPRSISPDEIITRHLNRPTLDPIGIYAHCPCCCPGCPETHRDPCDRHQGGDVA